MRSAASVKLTLLSGGVHGRRSRRRPPTQVDRFLHFAWAKSIAASMFIDSTFWYRYWSCHRLSHRSFSLDNRQFSICSRCTGLALGSIMSPLTAWLFGWSAMSAYLVIGFTSIDGMTQLLSARESTNSLRFMSGFCLPGATLSLLVLWIGS